MKNREDLLIERLKSQIAIGERSSSKYVAYPPVSYEELEAAESQLGFALPTLFKRVYCEVGDGGYGPSHGLLRLTTESNPLTYSVVKWYLGMRSMTQDVIELHWGNEAEEEKLRLWPQRLLTIVDRGCNIYSCMDCSQADCPIYREDSNISFSKEFALESPSLFQWLENWLDETVSFDWERARKVILFEQS